MPLLPRKNSVGLFGGGKPDDDKEEDAGILAYAKDDNAVSADFRLGFLQGRKTLQGKEDAPQRGGLRSKAQGQHDRSGGCVRRKSVRVLVKRRCFSLHIFIVKSAESKCFFPSQDHTFPQKILLFARLILCCFSALQDIVAQHHF